MRRRFPRRRSAGVPRTEADHARIVARTVRVRYVLRGADLRNESIPGVLKWSHVANETGVGNRIVQFQKTAQGMEPGVSDYFFAIRNDRGELNMVWLELKKPRGPEGGLNGSRIAPEQKEFVEVMNWFPNTAAHICHGSDELLQTLHSYIFTK